MGARQYLQPMQARMGVRAETLHDSTIQGTRLEAEAVTPKAWKSKVADLGCILCADLGFAGTPANLHHVREGQGLSQRASDWLVIPLCKAHHQGKGGIHDKEEFYRRYRMDELDLLSMTIEAVHAL